MLYNYKYQSQESSGLYVYNHQPIFPQLPVVDGAWEIVLFFSLSPSLFSPPPSLPLPLSLKSIFIPSSPHLFFPYVFLLLISFFTLFFKFLCNDSVSLSLVGFKCTHLKGPNNNLMLPQTKTRTTRNSHIVEDIGFNNC